MKLFNLFRQKPRPYYGEWWHASGATNRFEPKTRAESIAYTEGLRDAIRISREIERYSGVEGRVASPAMVKAMKQMHDRAKLFEGDGSEPCSS